MIKKSELLQKRKEIDKYYSNQQRSALYPKRNDKTINTTPIRTTQNRYQQLFLGYCFSCHNFGHKALDCESYRNKYHKSVQGHDHRNNKSSRNQGS